MEIGEPGQHGAHAQIAVEVELRPEAESATILLLQMEELLVLDQLLSQLLVIPSPAIMLVSLNFNGKAQGSNPWHTH